MENYSETLEYRAPEITIIKVMAEAVLTGSDQIDPIGGGETPEE